MNIKELKQLGINELIVNNVEDAAIKVYILLQYILNMNKTEILINEDKLIEEEKEKIFLSYIKEIVGGKPVQYITNKQEFMGMMFYVDENVLIPQPDTEILVERTINTVENILKNRKGNLPIKILDLCTGSGAIAISISKHIEKSKNDIEIYASDISNEALDIAKKNEISNCSNSKIVFINSDMFANLSGKFDIIVSNPPYIETEVIYNLSKEVQAEPHIALDGGKDGLRFYRIIAEESKKYLKPNGYLLLEIGYNQKESVSNIFKNYGEVICIKDLEGNDRVIEVRNS